MQHTQPFGIVNNNTDPRNKLNTEEVSCTHENKFNCACNIKLCKY